MAYYSRYGRRYRRYRKYRRFYRRYRRGYARKYVNGSSRSTVRMKTELNSTGTIDAGYGNSATDASVLAIRVYDGYSFCAPSSALYQTYCNLYEEVKCIGMKVSISVTDPVGNSTVPSLQFYTNWDRKCGHGEDKPSVQDIINSSTSNVATALNNNVAKIVRSCFASDLIEKATWIDATNTAMPGGCNAAWIAAGLNPNMFCPAFNFFFNVPQAVAKTTIHYTLSVLYYFAFRNPRYGGAGSSNRAKIIDLGARGSFPGDDDDGGDGMDDDVFAQMDAAPANPPAASEPPPDPDAIERRNAQIAANRRAQSQARVVAARNRLVGQVGPVQKN